MWPDAEETERLLCQARRGDRGALDRLLARHREAVRRAVSVRLDPGMRQRLDASDVVQEALAVAGRRLPEYLEDEDAAPFHVWLRGIALDRLVEARRRHHARKRDVAREVPPEPDASTRDLFARVQDTGPTPAAAALQEEMLRRFDAALWALPEQDREILLLRHVEQVPNQEAAEMLALTPAAASMRHLRALRRLRAELDGQDVDDRP